MSADTIFARASGAGKSGVAVYRISGPATLKIVHALVDKRPAPRRAELRQVKNPITGQELDHGLVILFPSPQSYTGEDVAELQLHGSRAVEASLFETLASLGARPAEPGEFTLRALRNGKMDLAQAEALSDLIDAETDKQRQQALGQLGGALSDQASAWRQRLIAILAPLEADVDFPDEGDVPASIAAAAGPEIASLKNELTTLLAESGQAHRIREGVSVAVIGPPNAGKSSLLNALAGSEVAIVSDTPGTTRDIVETRLDLAGVATTLADTAGLRSQTTDDIERVGITKAFARAREADIRVLVVDSKSSVSRETLLTGGDADVSRETSSLIKPGDFIVWNKSDIGVIPEIPPRSELSELVLSAKTGDGVEAFVNALTSRVTAIASPAKGGAFTRARHVAAARQAIDALDRAAVVLGDAPELAAEDVRLAARSLASITGAIGVEEILGEIFSSFCIGK